MQCDMSMLLVKTIEKFPCLYNFNLFEYLKKDTTDEAWNEVAKQTQLNVSECKEKWKNLRYGLLRSLRPNPDGSVKKRYYLHDEMEFVLPFMKTSKHDTIIPSIEESGMEFNVTIEQDADSSPAYPHYQELEIAEPPKKKSRPNETFVKKLHQNVTHYDDTRKMFLLGLLPEINALTELQMRIFRRKVLALIDEIGDIPTQFEMCLVEWQKDASQDSKQCSQSDFIKKEPV